MSPWFKKWLCRTIMWYFAFFIIFTKWGEDTLLSFLFISFTFFFIVVIRSTIKALKEFLNTRLEIYLHN